MNGQVLTNLAENLGAAVAEHQRLSGLSDYDVLTKQGGKLGREIHFRLKAKAPARGAIRAEVARRLASGLGVKVRAKAREDAAIAAAKSVYRSAKTGRTARKSNFGREVVRREVGYREAGRRALAVSILYPRVLSFADRASSRYGDVLSVARVRVDSGESSARYAWATGSERSRNAERGVAGPVGQRAITDAIDAVDADIALYTERKRLEVAGKAVQKLVRSGLRRAR